MLNKIIESFMSTEIKWSFTWKSEIKNHTKIYFNELNEVLEKIEIMIKIGLLLAFDISNL